MTWPRNHSDENQQKIRKRFRNFKASKECLVRLSRTSSSQVDGRYNWSRLTIIWVGFVEFTKLIVYPDHPDRLSKDKVVTKTLK